MDIKDAVFVLQLNRKEELLYHQRRHHHKIQDTEIHYFIEGNGIFDDGKNSYSINPGQLYLTPGGREHKINKGNCSTLNYYAVLIEFDQDESELIKKLGENGPSDIGLSSRFIFESVRDKGLSKSRNLRLSACHELLGLLYGLGYSFNVEDMLCIPVEKALRYMQNHLFEKFNLSDLAASVQRTPNYLDRLFKRKMETTPKKYFTSLQMEVASSLLSSSLLSIKEISNRFDFSSPFHFSKCFKDNIGLSPSDYRAARSQIIGKKQVDSIE